MCNDLNIKDLYIGSTTDFYNRKSNHKYKCNLENGKNYDLNIYKCIRANGGWDNWSMIEIEKFPCKDSLEARARERYWCEQLNATLNSNKPYITDNEIKEYKEEYYQNNKDKLLEYQNKYYNNNKDEIKEYKKEHYKDNKEKIKEQRKQLIICECGKTIQICQKARHERAKKHIDLLSTKNL